MHSFKGVPILVTGAGRGIGKRLAMGFATQGARVGLLARSKPELDLCQLEIEHAGGNALRIRTDVSDYEQVAAAIERMRVHFGSPVQVLVCAAAMQGPIGPFTETHPRTWDEVIHTNLLGVLNACRAVLPGMIERRSGKVIVLTSGGGSQARLYTWQSMQPPRQPWSAFVLKASQRRSATTTCRSTAWCRRSQLRTRMTDQILGVSFRDRAGWREVEEAQQVRLTGGITADKQIELALFLASEQSNHISGRLIHVHDDWKRLRDGSLKADQFTLVRRVQKI